MRLARVLVAAAAALASLPGAATAAPARLNPSSAVYRLAAGEARSIEYTLRLAAEPARPTDLYLLVDTSASMRPRLADLRRGVSDAMVRLLPWDSLRVGVGEFRTTSAGDWHERATYRAIRRIGAVDNGLEQAVERLGSDQGLLPPLPVGERAHTLALDESVTGDGHRPYVEAGQDAGFRPGARKVVVVVTDAAFAADSTQPSRADAIATLSAAGAEVFGLALHGDALGDLTAVASGTRSVADRTVDCGAGRRVATGRPNACVVSPDAIAGPLTGMLYERRRGNVTLSVTGTGVRGLAPRAWTVDRNESSVLRARLAIGCAAGDAGRSHRIGLTATAPGERVARAAVLVECVR